MNDNSYTAGNIISVNISTEKGTSKAPVPQIQIIESGVDGDAHAGDWHRQVSLLAMESIERFGAESQQTFACGDFAENITTRGIDLTATAPLDLLTIGDVTLEVTQLGKKCHGDGCAIYQQVGKCVMPREGIFCRVIKGGTVKAGDPIVHTRRLLKCRVITVSDRASQGVYADRSGPRVCELLERFCDEARWHADIESVIVPDEAVRIKETLLAARDSGSAVVITTGGTGIGPRDITPDVVMQIADKHIPGIMEHIRVKFGANKPNALLSRSVAMVMGNTLVYALPGSVKAVDEYMDEITKTLEHALYMLHGLDAH